MYKEVVGRDIKSGFISEEKMKKGECFLGKDGICLKNSFTRVSCKWKGKDSIEEVFPIVRNRINFDTTKKTIEVICPKDKSADCVKHCVFRVFREVDLTLRTSRDRQKIKPIDKDDVELFDLDEEVKKRVNS